MRPVKQESTVFRQGSVKYTLAFSKLATTTLTPVEATFFLDGDKSLYVTTGLHKLLSQAVFLLLTERGSVDGAPGLGLDIRERLGAVNLLDVTAVRQLLSTATRELTDQLNQITASNADDAKLGSITLAGYRVTGDDQLTVDLEITSVAGESARYDMSLITRVV